MALFIGWDLLLKYIIGQSVFIGMCVYDGCLDTWTFFFLFLIGIVKRDAFALFVRVIGLYKTSVLLLLLLLLLCVRGMFGMGWGMCIAT